MKKIFLFSLVFILPACVAPKKINIQKVIDAIDSRDISKLMSFVGKDDKVDKIALIGVGSIQPEKVPSLCLEKLNAKSANLRAAAAFAIGQCFITKPFTASIETKLLEQLKREKVPEVQKAILLALGKGGSEKALENVLKFDFKEVEVAVAQGLSISGFFTRRVLNKEAVNKCLKLASFLDKKKPSFFSSLYALSRLSDPKMLTPHLDSLTQYLKPEKNKEQRIFTTLIFASLMSPEGFNICYQMSQDKVPNVAAAAIQALKPYTQVPQIKEPILKLIVALFKSKSYHVVKGAVELGFAYQRDSLAKEMLYPAFEKLLSHNSSDIRFEAVKPLMLNDPLNAKYQKIISEVNSKKQSTKKKSVDTLFLNESIGEAFLKQPLPKATLETTKGTIEIELFSSEAPLTVRNFMQLAKQGFYDNTMFHRVVSNFVVQGGDPTATGRGGVDYAIRSEFTPRSFLKGVLGMASSGKDTEGSQFFMMIESQPHLDGKYTPFGRVVSGMDVVEVLEINDKILSIKISN